jgi:phage gp36-like protein
MAYTTNADVEERLGPATYVLLTDETGSGVADEGRVTEARLGAEGEVDSYLGRRYAVPVDVGAHPEVLGVLKSMTLDLIEYRLRARRPPVPDIARQKRDAVVQWLERIASGQAVLPSLVEVAGNEAAGVAGRAVGPARGLSRGEMEDL